MDTFSGFAVILIPYPGEWLSGEACIVFKPLKADVSRERKGRKPGSACRPPQPVSSVDVSGIDSGTAFSK